MLLCGLYTYNHKSIINPLSFLKKNPSSTMKYKVCDIKSIIKNILVKRYIIWLKSKDHLYFLFFNSAKLYYLRF